MNVRHFKAKSYHLHASDVNGIYAVTDTHQLCEDTLRNSLTNSAFFDVFIVDIVNHAQDKSLKIKLSDLHWNNDNSKVQYCKCHNNDVVLSGNLSGAGLALKWQL